MLSYALLARLIEGPALWAVQPPAAHRQPRIGSSPASQPVRSRGWNRHRKLAKPKSKTGAFRAPWNGSSFFMPVRSKARQSTESTRSGRERVGVFGGGSPPARGHRGGDAAVARPGHILVRSRRITVR
jgi:hypothetical protein